MIVNFHAHLGFDEIFEEEFSAEQLLDSQRRNGIGATLVQPSLVPDLPTVRRYHNEIAALCREHPGRFFGMANPNPHLPAADYDREVRRCVEELGFVGIKIHPLAHAVNPSGRRGRQVFELARELRRPVMVHTGLGIPWSAPALLESAAADFVDVPLIVAHAGGGVFAGEALQLAQRHANVFLECSWAAGFFIRNAADALGDGRLMFGSDHAEDAESELAKIRSLGLPPDALASILGGAAVKVFQIPCRKEPPTP